MKEFFKNYVLNYKAILFVAAFTGTYLYLRYQRNQKSQVATYSAGATQKTIDISSKVDQVRLLKDTSISLVAVANKTVPPAAIVLFDANCSLCYAALTNWKNTIEKEKLNPDKFLFIGYNASTIELDYIANKMLKPSYNLFKDSAFVFGTTNGFIRGKPKSFLMGSDWKILAEGDPFDNETLLQTFITELKK